MPFEALKINGILSKKIKTKVVTFKKYVNQLYCSISKGLYHMEKKTSF